ncbi:PEP-CTERM sorting domain-containing protein [Luteolibacter algae]|uniref:PEP-CTERM sorting domain-containing protein n=1 Tax=Luteolibacter algae TaxID=454151 RepID=A0ABW5D8C3_9BACT
MKPRNLIRSLAAIATASSAQAAIYSTSFDTPVYTAGKLSGKDGWLSQDQWTVDGMGNTTTLSGAYIRAQNTTIKSANTVGTTDTVKSTFVFGASTNLITNVPNGNELMYVLGLTEQITAPAPALAISGGLAYEDDSLPNKTLVLRGIGTDVVIGDANTFLSSTWTLTLAATKISASEYSVILSATSSASAGTIYSTAATTVTPASGFASATSTTGAMQALPSAGTTGSDGSTLGQVSGVTVRDYSFETVPEPGSTLMIALGSLLFLRRRR